jgi:peroxiredoxin
VLNLAGEVKDPGPKGGKLGAILVPDVDPFVHAFQQLGLLPVTIEIDVTLKPGAGYFMAEPKRADVGLPALSCPLLQRDRSFGERELLRVQGEMMGKLAGAVLATIGFIAGLGRANAAELKPGDMAPPFSLPGSDGKVHSLADLKGKTVVLAWFPKAFTGGEPRSASRSVRADPRSRSSTSAYFTALHRRRRDEQEVRRIALRGLPDPRRSRQDGREGIRRCSSPACELRQPLDVLHRPRRQDPRDRQECEGRDRGERTSRRSSRL